MPWFSYHSGHSGEFCRHAKGELRAVIERAIALGFTHYGLSEHCPRYRQEDLFGDEVDFGAEALSTAFAGYVKQAFALREQYAGQIELLVGFETERLPPDDWAARMKQLRASAPFEYMVGSVHDIDGCYVDYKPEVTRALAERLGGVEVLQVRYFDAVAELVETLRPEVVGHLDLVRKFDGPGASFGPRVQPHIERALEAVRAHGGVLDVNCGAHRRGLSPVYPLPAILQRAQQMGIGVTLGDDGHGAHDVGVGLDACMHAIAAAGYRELRYLARRDGVVQWQSAAIEDVVPARATLHTG
jgi:histidinol-phosphatase (PHP family)